MTQATAIVGTIPAITTAAMVGDAYAFSIGTDVFTDMDLTNNVGWQLLVSIQLYLVPVTFL